MQADAPTDPSLTPPPRALRVLVVEDDPETLVLTVEMVQLLGHWATGVKSAEVAKDRFMEGAFDVLLTDIGLPALSGYDLANSLLEHHQLRVIFATGQARPARPVAGTLWLQKPFGIEELEQALAEAAGRPQPRFGEDGTGKVVAGTAGVRGLAAAGSSAAGASSGGARKRSSSAKKRS